MIFLRYGAPIEMILGVMVQLKIRLLLRREDFYVNVIRTYAIVATGETSLFMLIILKNRVVVERENV